MNFAKPLVAFFSMLLIVFVAASSSAQINNEDRNKLPEIGIVASDALTIDKEKIVGAAIMRQLRGQAPLVNDPVLQEYIQDVGNRLVANADNTRFPFNFFIVNNPVLNAFAFPGGYVGVHSGLIARAETESELASVLAHEVAHVTQRHIARRIQAQERSGPFQIASLIGSILVAIASPEAGMAALQASMAGAQQSQINFTRQNEQEADFIGISILNRAGFDPQGAPAFFSRLAEEARSQSRQLAFLRTHPLPQDRVSETIIRANAYPQRTLSPSLPFHLVKARLQARYLMNPDTAMQHYTSLAAKNSGTQQIAAQYGKAIAFFEQGNYAASEKLTMSLLMNDKENLFYLDLLTDVFIKQKKFDAAVNLLKPHWQRKPQNRVLSLNLANAYLEGQMYDDSIAILRDMLLLDKQDILAYQLLHDAYRRTQRIKDAHMAQAEILALVSAYNRAIDELQFAYNFAIGDSIEQQRIKGRIQQLREADQAMRNLSL